MKNLYNLDDQELISLYLNGNSFAFDCLLTRHRDKVFTCIQLLVRDSNLSEDLFQDVFIKVIQTLRAGRYNEEGKFLPWVLRIARNICMDHFRKEKNIPLVKLAEDYDVIGQFSCQELFVEERMVKNESHALIRELIDQLPEDQREVIILRHFANLSFKEIAKLTNCNINTALGRMRYGLLNLRKKHNEMEAA
ncbi:MAG: polymerase subunit sigma-24 [Ferruginibacter sp.]|nr:polymerase subunit sigma-24 [Ferruginibacter sp.]